MKKVFLILIPILIFTASCDKQLVEKPQNRITIDNFYTNDTEAILGVNGIYSWLGSSGAFKSSLWRALDEGTDVIRTRTLANDPNVTYTVTSFNGGYSPAIWTTMYRGISNANTFIASINNSSGVTTPVKKRVLAEAKFLRSLNYYYLTGLFGDAVYYDETNNTIEGTQSLPRTSADEIRTKLIASLLEAEPDLPAKFTGADVGRATKGAAQALLVKLYLWQKKWSLAQQQAQEIVDSKTYSLLANYPDVFAETTEFNAEIIFEVDFEPILNGNDHQSWHEPHKQVGVAPFSGRSWYGIYHPYTTFVNFFEANDKRKASIVATGYNNQPFLIDPVEKIKAWSGPKFWRLNQVTDADGGLDMYVFRYADVLLMLAEAANENADPDKALWAVNEVRKRGIGATAVFTANLSKTAMTDYLFKERAIELYGEGHRRLDLIRWGNLVSATKTATITEDPFIFSNIQNHHALFPIPAVEIQKNTVLTQNPGYN